MNCRRYVLAKIIDESGSVVSADQQHGTQKQQIIVERPKYQALVLQVACPGISEKGNTIVIGNQRNAFLCRHEVMCLKDGNAFVCDDREHGILEPGMRLLCEQSPRNARQVSEINIFGMRGGMSDRKRHMQACRS